MGTFFNEAYERPSDIDFISMSGFYPKKDGEGFPILEPSTPLFDDNDYRTLEEATNSFNFAEFGSDKRKSSLKRIFSIFNCNEERIRTYLRKRAEYLLIDGAATINGISYRSCFLQIPNTDKYIDLLNLDGSNPRGSEKTDVFGIKRLLYMIDLDFSNSPVEAIDNLKRKYAVLDEKCINLSSDVRYCYAPGHSSVLYGCKQQSINVYKNDKNNDLLVPVRGGFIRLVNYTPIRYRACHLIPSFLKGSFFIPGETVETIYYMSYTRKKLGQIAAEQRRNH